MKNKKRGKKNYIIINAEGIGDSINMAKRIEAATGIETRATILGHMQRGGSPTCKDRVYASIMGSMAVDLLCQGKTNRVVGYKNGEYVDYDIEEALAMKKNSIRVSVRSGKNTCTVRKNRHIFLKTCRYKFIPAVCTMEGIMQMDCKKTAPVGVFDSGVGGLTVAREISRQLPNENIVYFGDTARVPYGSKSQNTIIRFSEQIIRFLKTKQVKAIVIACNTASALALDAVRDEFDIPIMGVVIPGARAAVETTRNQKVGVIGTDATVQSGMYTKVIQSMAPDIEVIEKACPLFVPLVEEGFKEHVVTEEVIEYYLESMRHTQIDAMILGCTHYPLLRSKIRDYLGEEIK